MINSDFVVWNGSNVNQIGGKAANLNVIQRHSLPVPPFFVVTTAAFHTQLSTMGLTLDMHPDSRLNPSELMCKSQVDPAVEGALHRAYARLIGESACDIVAVRSSAIGEDALGSSFAGQFTSVLGVPDERALVDAVKRCWSSAFSSRLFAYRKSHGMLRNPDLALIIQQQIFPKVSGVLFTVHPISKHIDTIYVL